MPRPDYIPDDWTNWADVRPYSWESGGYDVIRADDGMRFATFVQKSDAELFAKMKNDVLLAGDGI